MRAIYFHSSLLRVLIEFQLSLDMCLTEPTSGPKNRRARISKAAESPVAKKVCVAEVLDGARNSEFSTRVR
jgi:hypothetical protein